MAWYLVKHRANFTLLYFTLLAAMLVTAVVASQCWIIITDCFMFTTWEIT